MPKQITSIYDFGNMSTSPHLCTRSKMHIIDTFVNLRPHYNIEQLQGFLKRDYILDWLTLKGNCLVKDEPQEFMEIICRKKDQYIMNCQSLLSEKSNNTVECTGDYMTRKYQTDEFIKSGKPIILNACIVSTKYPIYANIHALIHSSILSNLIRYHKIPKDVYICVTFQYRTVHINSSNHVLSKNNSNCCHTIISVIQAMVNESLNQRCTYAITVPKKIVCNKPHLEYYVISLPDYRDKCMAWCDWIGYLYKHVNDWSPTRNYYHILPNMSNHIDYPWRTFKSQFSKYIGDITQVWSLGVNNRNILYKKGIYHWKDVNPYILDVPRSHMKTIHKFIRINKQSNINMFDKINDVNRISVKCDMEYFVDFETINSIGIDFGNDRSQYIFMIGCLRVCVSNSSLNTFKTFVTKDASLKEEKRIIKSWFDFMGTGSPVVYHWGHAEPTFLKHSLQYHNGQCINYSNNIRFIDMCQLFRDESLVVRTTWSFGLKTVAKAMYLFGYIETNWEDDTSGMSSMVDVWQIIERGQKINTHPSIKPIIEYNRIDCVVLWEILSYLRKINNI